MFHLKVGLAPKTLFSILSGSLSCQTLTLLVIFLLTQTCGGNAQVTDEKKEQLWREEEERRDVTMKQMKEMENKMSAAPSGCPFCFPPAAFYPVLAIALVVFVAFIGFGFYIWKCKGIAQVTDEKKEQLQMKEKWRDVMMNQMKEMENKILGIAQVPNEIKEQLRREEEERRDVMMNQMKEMENKMLGIAQVTDEIKEQLRREEEERRDVMMKQMKEMEKKMLGESNSSDQTERIMLL